MGKADTPGVSTPKRTFAVLSSVHNRPELVEPLLVAHSLCEPEGFARGLTDVSEETALRAIRQSRLVEEDVIALALALRNETVAGQACRPIEQREFPIAEQLMKASSDWLVCDGNRWLLKVEPTTPGREILRWRAASMLLPPSVWVAAAMGHSRQQSPTRLEVLPGSIAPNGLISHAHVHLGPLLHFEHLWSGLWRYFLVNRSLDALSGSTIASQSPPATGKLLKPPKAHPGRRWQWMLELACYSRSWLLGAKPTLAGGYIDSVPPPPIARFARGTVDEAERTRVVLSFWRTPAEWARGRPPDGHTEPSHQSLASSSARALPRLRNQARDVHQKMLARQRTRERQPDPFPEEEVRLVADCLTVIRARRARKANAHAEWLERVFYQYLRVKIALYRYLIVDPWKTGLDHFLDVEQRDRPYTNLMTLLDGADGLEHARLQPATFEPPLRVGSLEVHVIPEKWIERKRPRLGPLDTHESYRHPTGSVATTIPSAWILSFVRAPPTEDFHKAPGRAWCRKAAEVATTCRRITMRLASQPSALRAVRALGLMALERNGPVWLFVGPFRRLLHASRQIAAKYPGMDRAPLRTAMHLGEDFDHILTGLRQVYEPFEWELVARGDRIGHAMALGLDPEQWVQRCPWVRMRPWDRLLDIGFIYWAFQHSAIERDQPSALSRYRIQAEACLHQILGIGPSFSRTIDGGAIGSDPLALAKEIWEYLPYAAPEASRLGNSATSNRLSPRDLVKRVLHNQNVARRAVETSLSVDTSLDLPVTRAVQRLVAERVAAWQVAIEVNPSSNLLIGGFRSMFEQPLFHDHSLPITINGDDPLTFATTLADEYAYAWAGMVVAAGVAPIDATRRLEHAAECSRRFGFTISRPRA